MITAVYERDFHNARRERTSRNLKDVIEFEYASRILLTEKLVV